MLCTDEAQMKMACTQTFCPAASSFAYNMHHKAACIKSTNCIFTSTITSLFRDVGHMPLQRCGLHWPWLQVTRFLLIDLHCWCREEQPVDIHAMTAAVLLEKFLGPSTVQSQDELVSAEGTLKRADAAQRPSNRTWHGAYNFNAFASQSDTIRQVSLGVPCC